MPQPKKPKPVDIFSRPREYLVAPTDNEQERPLYDSTASSISEIKQLIEMWGGSEAGLRTPQVWTEPQTVYSEFVQALGFYFFQYRDFPVIEYLLEIFLERGCIPQQDYFREYLPDKTKSERLHLIHLLENLFKNALGSYRGILLHFLDEVAAVMIADPHIDAKGLLQHVPTQAKHQREILARWLNSHILGTFGDNHFLWEEDFSENLTPYQIAFISELLYNGKLEEYERILLEDLPINPDLGLTAELAKRIYYVWLMFMLSYEFSEGILINANNSSKVFYSDRIMYDGVSLIRNWFQVCQANLPRVVQERSHKEVDIYLKIKWKLKDMENLANDAEPLPPTNTETNTHSAIDPEVHILFRCRLDQIVGNHGFDRKTGMVEAPDGLANELEDYLTSIAIEMYNWSGYAHKPKGKRVYLEIYADQIPPLTARLYHITTELNARGNGFKGIDRSVPPEDIPRRHQLLTMYAYNRVLHKSRVTQVMNRQKVMLWAPAKSLLDRATPPKPTKPTAADTDAADNQLETYQPNLF